MNLLFSMDAGYIKVFAGCLKSILRYGGQDTYNIYILHSDLHESHKEQIKALSPACTFHFIEVDPAMFKGFPTSSRYPLQIYYRLAAPMLLPHDLDRILYLDGDIVVINSLSELYNTDFEGRWIAACTHTGSILNSFNQVRLGTESSIPYINSGVMLYNLPALRAHMSLKDIQAYAAKKDLLLFLPDQDILTALYGNHIKVLDWRKYNLGDKTLFQNNISMEKESLSLEWIRKNTAIIHYFGRNKPWKSDYVGILSSFYTRLEKPAVFGICIYEDKWQCRNLEEILLHHIKQLGFLDAAWLHSDNLESMPVSIRDMVVENAAFVLQSMLAQKAYESVAFAWPQGHDDLLQSILNRLDLQDLKVVQACITSQPVTKTPDFPVHLQAWKIQPAMVVNLENEDQVKDLLAQF